jgi:hypothetical protein
VFLEINGVSVAQLTNDQVYDLVLWVAASSPSHGAITQRLQLLLAT